MDSKLSEVLINSARGVGSKRAGLLGEIGITTVQDSLYYLPCRYIDRSSISNIFNLIEGQLQSVRGIVISTEIKMTRGRGKGIYEINLNDGTAVIKARWFNQPFIRKNISVGQELLLNGMVKRDAFSGLLVFDNPEYEVAGENGRPSAHSNRIVPVYGLTEGLSQKQLRNIMFGIIEDFINEVIDPLPEDIIKRLNLPSLRESLKELHFPADGADTDLLNRRESIYHKRLIFDELFMFELWMALLKRRNNCEKGRPLSCGGIFQRKLIEKLPFELTGAQMRVLSDIRKDMAGPHPMRRLLQGDVGCGKTIVAIMAILHAVECGCQAAVMAPTEVLAEQHYYTISSAVEGLGLKTKLVVGGMRERHIDRIASGEADIVIGTHALIQGDVAFSNLGLAIIDEQHKFGVTQRGLLRKKGQNPHVIVMTATPIPRSLALTLYGDLEYSVISEMPAGREPVVTRAFTPEKRSIIYKTIEEQIKNGRQVYVVYPVIEESEKADFKSAVQGYEAFQKIFPEFGVGLLHGRMSPADKQAAMISFKERESHILVSTSVIEVGLDVPNATVMVIVHAERFGLAQLHQLRGRVGRGAGQSFCLLICYEPLGEDAARRIDIMVKTADGFEIAEKDLEIRGPGQFFGTRQAGVPDFRLADISRDIDMLEIARKEAFKLIGTGCGLDGFPLLRRFFDDFFAERTDCYQTA